MVLLAGGRGSLGLALLLHALHLSVLALHFLTALLAVVLGLAVLTVIHGLVLGMWIGRRSRLSKCGNGKRKRKRANNGLHLNISENPKLGKCPNFSRVSEVALQFRV